MVSGSKGGRSNKSNATILEQAGFQIHSHTLSFIKANKRHYQEVQDIFQPGKSTQASEDCVGRVLRARGKGLEDCHQSGHPSFNLTLYVAKLLTVPKVTSIKGARLFIFLFISVCIYADSSISFPISLKCNSIKASLSVNVFISVQAFKYLREEVKTFQGKPIMVSCLKYSRILSYISVFK